MEKEIRVASTVWPEQDFELRTTGDGLNFQGYAAVFDSPSEDLGGFVERIAPGAFTESLRRRKGDIKMFLNHDERMVLGSKGAGTLRLKEDGHGLFVDADLPDNEWGRPVRDAVARGDISSMSFAFNVPRGGDEWSADRKDRTLRNLYLHEVSPVTGWPAYPATSASVRHLAELIDEDPDTLTAAVREFLSDATELTDETRRLMRALAERGKPEPFVPDEFVAARLAKLQAIPV